MGNKRRRDDLPVEVVHVDLADQNSIAALVAATGEAERVAIAAGIYSSAPALETTLEQIDSVMAINLYGVFFLQLKAIPVKWLGAELDQLWRLDLSLAVSYTHLTLPTT